jgi:PAS domain S-box-containing protein
LSETNTQLHTELENRIRFETLISDISARFVRLPSGEVDSEIDHALKQVLDFFDVDRCGVLEVQEDKEFARLTHVCYAEGVEPLLKNINMAQLFPWTYEMMTTKGLPARVGRMTELPPEAEQDRQSCWATDVKSFLCIPLFCAQGIRYLLAIQSVRDERIWPEEFIPRLTLLGELFVNALERRDAELTLRKSQERLNLATDSAGVGLWIMDLHTHHVWVTPKLRELFNFASDEEVNYDSFFKVIYPEDHEVVHRAVEHTLQTKEKLYIDYRIVLPDGEVRWIGVRGRPYFNSSGELDRLMGVSLDITDRKWAEEAFRSSKARLEAGADLAGLGCYEVDFGEPSVFVDVRFGEICGLPSGKQQGLQTLEFWMEHLHPGDCQHIFEERRKLHEGTIERLDLEYRYLHPTAGQKWIHHVARVAKRDQAKNTVQSFGVIQDITESKRLSEQIQVAAEEWQSTFDSINDMIMVLDRDYRIIRVNKSTESFWGLPSEEIIGNPCYALMHADGMSSENCPAANVLKTKQFKEAEVYLDQKNVWLSVTVSPILDHKGGITGFIHSAKDITGRKQAEEEIRRIREEYVHMARVSAMGELTASLAHELKQPLAAIRSNAQAALRFLTGDNPDIDELHEVLKDIIADNRRADDVIGKLRALMRKSRPQVTALNLKELVQDILPLIASHEDMRKISLSLELDETIPLAAGDRIQIQQVILNLILNSTEALMTIKKPLRSIIVQAHQQDAGRITVSVKDNGPGIEIKAMPHLFEPFYTTKQEGLGMGLAICRSIVEEHGGRLWGENNPDGGAVFYFTIPIAGENSA